MSQYQLVDDLYIFPTPAGVFHAVTCTDDKPVRRLLRSLLGEEASPKAELPILRQWLHVEDDQEALALLHRAQTMGWIQGFEEPHKISGEGIGQEIQNLIPHLSSIGKGLLVDANGFSLVRCGIDDETADTLSALSADLIAVQNRHAKRLEQSLGLTTHGWGSVDAYGASRIGVWPLYMGSQNFLLVLLGVPQLNRPEFVSLVWELVKRYGK